MSDRPVKNFQDEVCQPFFFPGDGHGVLLIHGFTGSASHMRLLGEHLRDRGFTVMGIDLPGHASSEEEMGKCTWRDWLEASRKALCELKAQCERVSVSGLSMGGVITLLLAEERTDLTAIAPISAPMAVQNKLMPFARIAAPFVKRIAWNDDPERAKLVDPAFDYGYEGFPTHCAADLSHLIKLARRDLSAVTCPVLTVQSHGDETIAKDSAEVIISGVSSKRKGTLYLEEVPHVCTISREHQHIADAIADHFRQAEQE